ncbi:MAG: CNNM domain-containing protein [Steroidobacteraceae bacterium]
MWRALPAGETRGLHDIPTVIMLLALGALLLLVAFSSGTEVALRAANRYRIRSRAARGERAAKVLEAVLAKPDDWLGANLILLTLASAGATTIATLLAVRSGQRYALLLPTLLMPILMLVFCVLAPKILAAVYAERVALRAARAYHLLVAISRPGVSLANFAAQGLLRLFGIVRGDIRSDAGLSTEALRAVVADSGPVLPQRHRQMLLSILDLEHATVNDIMIPRQEIAGIDLEDDWEQILAQLRSTPHTRLPVYRGDIDQMVGLLHMKRVAQELAHGTLNHQRLAEIASTRDPYFVPEGASLMIQLANFQRNRRRVGFVVDEYGDVMGLVTLEDLLEEIVGEFTNDPATMAHRDIQPESPGVYLINASATNRALNRALGWNLPTDGPKTLNGLLLERLETIPPVGTVLRVGDREFEVLQIADNTIRTVRVRDVPPP